MYIVVFTCDVINSKSIKNLESLLTDKLIEANCLLTDSLITNINTSRGDEIQFVLKLDNLFFENIMKFRSILYPIKVRIAASISNSDKLTFNSKNSWDLNGEPFFLARDILDTNLKKEKDSCIFFKSVFSKYDYIFNSFYTLNDIIIKKWRLSQWELVKNYFKTNDKKKLDKLLNIKSEKNKVSSTLYERIKRLNIEEIKYSEQQFLKFLHSEGDFF